MDTSKSNKPSKAPEQCINNTTEEKEGLSVSRSPHTLKPFTAFFICFIAYFVVSEAFLAIPQFNGTVQIRPASALGPTLGFFFGVPGILGCACANLLSDFLHESCSKPMLFAYFLIQIAYNGMLRWVWYFVYRKSENPYPRFDSSMKTALYMALALADGVGVNLVNMYVVDTAASAAATAAAFTKLSLNNVWMLLFVGTPLLYALERCSLSPRPPRWIHAPYQHIEKANIAQRFVIAFTLIAAGLLILISLITIVYEANDENLTQIVSTLYMEVALLAVPIYLPMFVLLNFLERHFVYPIEVLANDQKTFIERVEDKATQGQFDLATPVDERGTKPQDEVAELFDSTNKMRKDLAGLVKDMYNMTAQRQRSAAELDIARQIQMGVVPNEFSAFTQRLSLDIAGFMRPAREVGGDFYDVFDVGEHDIAFVVGDVSGKGVPAALFMMRAQNLLRQCILRTDDLGAAFVQANSQLCERNDALLFVTAFACVLDTTNGKLRYVNAGHNAPALKRGDTAQLLRGKRGLVLGAMDEMNYHEESFVCEQGDSLLLYTDGITESANEHDELYGEDRMLEVLKSARTDTCGVQKIVDALVVSVDTFANGAPQADDITMLSFSWSLPVHEITLPPQTEHLDELFSFLEPLCQTKACTPRMMAELMLVCEEVFTNICNYGFPEGKTRPPVNIVAIINEQCGCLYLTFSDQGIAYNPLRHKAKKVDPSDEERKGGLGILLIRKYLDDLSYTRSNGKNILRMTKYFV